LENKNKLIGIIGLGYVGLPLSIVFSKKYKVIGYDSNSKRVNELNNFKDSTLEVTSNQLKKSILTNGLIISNDPKSISKAEIYIIAVPTPIDKNKSPDLNILKSATKLVSGLISKGDIVVFESTVFPGCTEEVCVPILQRGSKLVYNTDFFCGYSPERVNPGDKNHTIEKIVKVTSGSTEKIANEIDDLYSSVITAGTYKASSLKVAEAAKVIENAQRDINIAFVNELARMFDLMDIDTNDVLDAASTKWNFLNFRPGLVGGHCIGVDPYYLADRAKEKGYNPEIILAGRFVNDDMGNFVASQIINLLNTGKENKALILGVTFKENCPDFRNTKVVDIVTVLNNNNISTDLYDPWVDSKAFKSEFNLEVYDKLPIKKYDAIIFAVSHDCFINVDLESLKFDNKTIVYDLKGVLNKENVDKRL
jgi:UDP-N-acetyl-D-galactosamine dehydrogenase